MRRAAPSLFFVLVVVCVSCFASEAPEGYRCDQDSADACPSGQVCDVPHGCCRKPGSSCAPSSPDDLASLPDMTSAPDQAEPFGCMGRGAQLGPGLYGCDGPFAAKSAAKLCAPGYALADERLTAAEFSACAKAPGFYLSTSVIYHSATMVSTPVQCNPNNNTLQCTPPSFVTYRFRLGCGAYRFPGYLECMKSCGPLYQVASCYPPRPIDCLNSETPGTLDDTTTNPNIGVLCRRK
jgi:hypothetical protein